MMNDISSAAIPFVERADLHRALVDGLPHAIVVCTGGTIRYANASGCRLLGAQKADELLGREFIRFVQPHDVPSMQQLQSNASHEIDQELSSMIRFMRLDGTEVVAAANAISVGVGTVQFLMQEPDDVRKAPGRTRSEERYRTYVEESLDAVVVTSVSGEVLFCNSAASELFGVTGKEDLLHRHYATLCVDAEHREVLLQALSRQGFIKNFEYEIVRADGRHRTVLENASLVRDHEGHISSYRSFLRDITEWKSLEQQLFQAQKMESMMTLIGGIGHDFINVLNNMRGFAGQLRKHIDEKAKVVKYADTLQRSAERGLGLAHKLLALARKKKQGTSQSFVQEVVPEIVDIVRETFRKDIFIETDVDDSLPAVNVDSSEVYQAIMNICINAQDAMPDGGRVLIEAKSCPVSEGPPALAALGNPRQQFVRINISDTGSGIPEMVRERIFDPFFTTKSPGKGIGLGLSIVYNIVTNHQGVVTVESKEQQGSTFSMYFPIVEKQTQRESAQHTSGAKSQNNELILLVDDEITMQELGRELLEEQGYRVLVARDGLEAVELYRRHAKDISLVILDLLMPRLDGGQAYVELKKINNDVKVFFCTGFSPRDMVGSLMEGQSLRALQKPFRPEDFLGTVREVLTETAMV